MSSTPNIEPDLERAFVREALLNYPKYSARGVSPEDYALSQARAIVDACGESWDAHGSVSLESAATELQRAGKLDGIGGTRGLAEFMITSAVPDVARLRDLRRLRNLRDRALEAAAAAASGDLDAAIALISEAHTTAMESSAGGDVKSFREMSHAYLEDMIESAKAGTEKTVHPGLDHLHEAIGGLTVGSMLMIIANTNVGKSSVILEMMLKCAERGIGTGLVSVEDDEEMTVRRALSAHSGLPSRMLQEGKLDAVHMQRLFHGVEKMDASGSTMFFSDCAGGSDLDVCAAMSRMAHRGAKIVIVDYIGEVEASHESRDGRRNDIRWVAKRLKVHAKRCGVALVIVSQITRPSDKNPNREPTKHDAKESGDLENMTTTMLGLWREVEDDWADIHVKVLKHKSGGNGLKWRMARDRGTPDRPGSGRLREIGDGPGHGR